MASDPVKLVRLLIADTDPEHQLLSDQELQDLLTCEGGNVKLAAAQALCVIANSETLISKKITTQDLSVDGPAVARDLREQADRLRKEVADEQANSWGFEIVPFNPRACYQHSYW